MKNNFSIFNPRVVQRLNILSGKWIHIRVNVDKAAYSSNKLLAKWNNEFNRLNGKLLKAKILQIIHAGVITHTSEGKLNLKKKDDCDSVVIEDLTKWQRFLHERSLPSLVVIPGKNKGGLIKFSTLLGESVAAYLFQTRSCAISATLKRLPEKNDADVDFLITDKVKNLIGIEAKGKKNGEGRDYELKQIKKSGKKKRPATICYSSFVCYKTQKNNILKDGSYLWIADPPTSKNINQSTSDIVFMLIEHYIGILSLVGLWDLRDELKKVIEKKRSFSAPLISNIPRPPIKANVKGNLPKIANFQRISHQDSFILESQRLFLRQSIGVMFNTFYAIHLKAIVFVLIRGSIVLCPTGQYRFFLRKISTCCKIHLTHRISISVNLAIIKTLR